MREYLKLVKYQEAVESAIEALEKKISPHIDFDFSIEHFNAEGWMVTHVDMALPIRMETVICLIKKGDKLTSEFVRKYSAG